MFDDVENTKEIVTAVIKGDLDVSILDTNAVLSSKVLLAACQRACYQHVNHKLVASTLGAEVAYRISPYRGVGEALREFGAKETSRSIVIVGLLASTDADGSAGAVAGVEEAAFKLQSSISGLIKGKSVPNPCSAIDGRRTSSGDRAVLALYGLEPDGEEMAVYADGGAAWVGLAAAKSSGEGAGDGAGSPSHSGSDASGAVASARRLDPAEAACIACMCIR